MVKVDLLLTNANVLTLDEHNSHANVIGSYKGKITGIWSTEEFQQMKETIELVEQFEEKDLEGATVLPGFIDTHNHILMYGITKSQVDCSPNTSKNISEMIANLKKWDEEHPGTDWILGFGYDDTLLEENRHPTREDLDKVSTTRPIYVKHISSHFAVANTFALKLAKLDATIVDPEGGFFGRDENNELNGVLYEPAAMNMVFKHAPVPSKKELIELIELAAKDYVAQGITTSSEAGIGFTYGADEYEIHMEAINKKANPLKMRLMILNSLLLKHGIFESYTAEELNKKIIEDSNGMAKLDSAKLFQDGSIQGFTGALRKGYYSNEDEYGELIFNQETLEEMVIDFHNRGFRIATHGNGDRAIDSIIQAYKKAIDLNPRQDHRHRIEHVQTATSEDLSEMEKYNIAASFFINHVYYWGDRHKNIFLGPERAERMNPLKEADQLELLYTLHSDCPITAISPLFSVWAAVNRVTKAGVVLGEKQKIDVISALKAMTIYGAKLNFEENEIGSIEVGKYADFVVVDEDPVSIDPMKIKDIRILSTIINGKVVYENSEENMLV